MKLALNYYKPITCELQHSIYLLTEKEYHEFQKTLGEPDTIVRKYPQCTPEPFAITGTGWAINEDGYSKEAVYIRKKTYKRESI